MTARTDLIADLKRHLPRGSKVIGYEPDSVTEPTHLVFLESITRPDQLGLHRLQIDFGIWLLVGSENPEKASDQADDALMELLGALQGIDQLWWSSAERGVYDEKWHGYKLTVTKVAQIED